MKALIFFAVVAAVRAASLHYAPAAAVETGASTQFRSEDNLGNYNFGYNEDHTSGGTFRREAGDAHGNVAGSYGLRDADGRLRIVNYIANDDGFKADIKTNEPGVEPKDPADATINKSPVVAVAEAVPIAVAAPAPIALAVPEPHHPVAVKSGYVFPAPTAAVKSVAVAEPAPIAIPAPVIQPVPAAFPVAKTEVTEHKTVVHDFPAPAAVPVAKSHTVTFQQHAPVSYEFPAPAAIPVAKSAIAIPEPAPVAVPAPYAVVEQAPVAKSTVSVVETAAAPAAYAFPAPAAVAVPKSAFAYAAPAHVPVAAAPATSFAYSTHVVNAAPAHYAPIAAAPAHHLAYAAPAPHHYAPFAPFHYGLHSPVVSYAGPVLRFDNIAYNGFPLIKK